MADGRKRWRPGGPFFGGGCGTLIFVFLIGGLLSLFGTAFGLGVSIGVPFMQSNITAAGAIGAKAKVIDGLPEYVRGRVAGDQNFINQSGTTTVGPAKGALVFVVGAQPGAPSVDLYIAIR